MQVKKSKARSLLHVAVALGTIAAAVIVTACSKDAGTDTDEQGIGLTQLTPVAGNGDGTAVMPLDAVPSPDGKDIYFIAFTTQQDEDGIASFRVPAIFKAVPGAPALMLASGSPLNAPFGLTISEDGQTLYIADTGADTSDDRSDGMVFSMGVSGGTPSPLAGTAGMAPAGIDAMNGLLYITGTLNGQPGLYKMPEGGGALSPVAVGAPFMDPGGVAVAHDGTAYVVDTGSAYNAQSLASVVRVNVDGTTAIVKDGLSVGHPAGIALSIDDQAVLVSGLDDTTGNDRVFRIAVGAAGGAMGVFSSTIDAFSESAGLHRARNAETYAWADTHANTTGTVYSLAK